MGCQVQERGACGQNGTNSNFCSKGPETIRQTPGNWTTYKSQCSCRTQHEPDLLGPEPAPCKKGRQEWRGKSERTEKCEVERDKSKQCAALNGHGSADSSRESGNS
jgi:hypothetical protein